MSSIFYPCLFFCLKKTEQFFFKCMGRGVWLQILMFSGVKDKKVPGVWSFPASPLPSPGSTSMLRDLLPARMLLGTGSIGFILNWLFSSLRNLRLSRINAMPWCEMNSFYKVNNNMTGKKNVNQSARKIFTCGSLTVQSFPPLLRTLFLPCSRLGQMLFL